MLSGTRGVKTEASNDVIKTTQSYKRRETRRHHYTRHAQIEIEMSYQLLGQSSGRHPQRMLYMNSVEGKEIAKDIRTCGKAGALKHMVQQLKCQSAVKFSKISYLSAKISEEVSKR